MSADQAILEELYKAAERLGAKGEEIRNVPAEKMYAALEALGADRFLLGVVGSWKDCTEDAVVLKLLRAWNRHGKLEFDEVYASTSRRS
jgi:hypothetical protein